MSGIQKYITPPKKPKCLTLHQKSLIIEQLNKGASVTILSKKYGVSKSTICKIKTKKQEILSAVMNTYTGPGKRRTLRGSAYPKMEEILYKWFLSESNKNCMASGEMLKQKAISLNSKIMESDKEFKASDGWLHRFKTRFGIRYLKVSDEKLSAQPELVEPFKIIINKKINELGITLDQIYNADESGLYWKLLPNKILVSSKKKTAPGKKTEKQRITFLACTNATGSHKVKPLVIGKATNPRSFKNFSCPVDYEHSKSAWMTATIFKNWFHHSFVPQVKRFLESKELPTKALLLVDNAPSHPPIEELKSEDGLIITMFLPPNVTPLVQPMDQNVLSLTKLYYRNNLLKNLIANGSNTITDSLKELTIKDAVVNLMAAWNRLDSQVIAKCWKTIFEDNEDEDNLSLSILKRCCDHELDPVSNTIQLLNTLLPHETFKDTDVMEWNNTDTQCEPNMDDESDNETEENLPEI